LINIAFLALLNIYQAFEKNFAQNYQNVNDILETRRAIGLNGIEI